MTWRYRDDRMVGHDYPGVCGPGMHDFTLTELELGARAALALDDPEQAWWELEAAMRREEPDLLTLARRRELRQHGWLPCPACQGDHYVEDCTDERTVDWWADVELDDSEALNRRNEHGQDPGE